jgi:hypothetical protein
MTHVSLRAGLHDVHHQQSTLDTRTADTNGGVIEWRHRMSAMAIGRSLIKEGQLSSM